MTPKKLTLMLSLMLLLGGTALTWDTATAQEPAPAPRVPVQPGPEFSMFFSGGTFLGVHAEDVSKENMGQYNQPQVRGVGITEVVKDSPAEKAGLKKGDVILRFDSEAVTSTRKLTRLVNESSPDQTTRLTISRGGSEQEVAVTLGKRSGNADAWRLINPPGASVFGVTPKDFPKDFRMEQIPRMSPNGDGNFFYSFGNSRRIGVATQALSKQLADFFGVSEGSVLITSVNDDSPAAKAGLRAGDVITAIDGEKLTGSGDLSRGLSKKEAGDVTLTVVRDKNERTVKVTPTKGGAGFKLPSGRISNDRNIIRQEIRDAIKRGARNGQIVIPSINIPTIPAINVTMPEINLPVIPEIKVDLPRVRVQKRAI
jgi:membrane-associated protease RseP (regulator of RpoE activity)